MRGRRIKSLPHEPVQAHPFPLAINALAPGTLAEISRQLGAVLIHYSTDYVFDGKKRSPYTEVDAPNPLGVYAAAKLAGDSAIQAVDDAYLIFRSA